MTPSVGHPLIEESLWRTSTRSGEGGQCVQVAHVAEQQLVAVRDSKNPAGGTLCFDREAFAGFVEGIKAGDFDLP